MNYHYQVSPLKLPKATVEQSGVLGEDVSHVTFGELKL